MDRRFKIGYISINEVSAHNKDFGEVLKKALPENTQILEQISDFDTASLKVLLHNPDWPLVAYGKKVEKFTIKTGEVKMETGKKVKIAYSH